MIGPRPRKVCVSPALRTRGSVPLYCRSYSRRSLLGGNRCYQPIEWRKFSASVGVGSAQTGEFLLHASAEARGTAAVLQGGVSVKTSFPGPAWGQLILTRTHEQ